MKPGLFFAAIIATFVVGFAVGRVSAPTTSPSTASSSFTPTPAPPMMPPMSATEAPPPTGAGAGVSGTVAEVIQVQSYTYLRLTTPQGEQWAAVTRNDSVKEGQAVRLASATEMTGFTSKTLNRTFDRIWFGELEGSPAAGGGAPMGAMPPLGEPSGAQLPAGHPAIGGAPSAGAAGALAAVEQAGDALSLRVADVFSERAALAGKKVRVHGTAAKVTAVQGAYYVHLKDGSGTAGKDDDLVVVSGTEVKADQQLTLEGRVALDKDVGMGTSYPVVVENATVVGP